MPIGQLVHGHCSLSSNVWPSRPFSMCMHPPLLRIRHIFYLGQNWVHTSVVITNTATWKVVLLGDFQGCPFTHSMQLCNYVSSRSVGGFQITGDTTVVRISITSRRLGKDRIKAVWFLHMIVVVDKEYVCAIIDKLHTFSEIKAATVCFLKIRSGILLSKWHSAIPIFVTNRIVCFDGVGISGFKSYNRPGPVLCLWADIFMLPP